jgi:hypothetical protein
VSMGSPEDVTGVVPGAVPVADPVSIGVSSEDPEVPEPLTLAPNGDEDDDDEVEEQVAKRPRLGDPTQDQPLDDEAVLALAAHNNPTAVDAYPSE